MELVWCWANQYKNIQTEQIAGKGHHWTQIGIICVKTLSWNSLNIEEEWEVKDTSHSWTNLFAKCQDKRKYNRRRLRLGDHRPNPNDNGNSYSDSSSCSNILKTMLTKKIKILKKKKQKLRKLCLKTLRI